MDVNTLYKSLVSLLSKTLKLEASLGAALSPAQSKSAFQTLNKFNAMKNFTFEECVVELQHKKQRPSDMDANLVSISGQQVQSKRLEWEML